MQEISLKNFLYHISHSYRTDKQYCFILGAGASKQSGIPTGAEMAKEWLNDLKQILPKETYLNWTQKEKISVKDPARDYSRIYEKRFADEREGIAYLEKKMADKYPSCGYAILTQILESLPHRIVITTNFDSLIEDALFIYSRQKPLVIGHENLANFIDPQSKRPIIIKVHRDLLLSPKSKKVETENLDKNFKRKLTDVFTQSTPLIIGYGGNDGSLMGFLENLTKIEGGIYWFFRSKDKLNHRIKSFLKKFDGFAIPIEGFDQLMIQLGDKLDLGRFDGKIMEIAGQRAQMNRAQINEIQHSVDFDNDTKNALSRILSKGKKDWLPYESSQSGK